jgi:hypothetical protein
MSAFSWLLIGHLVGDWLLQNHWMSTGKKRNLFNLPGIAHFLIYTAAIMVVLQLASPKNMSLASYLLVGVVILISHWAIDTLDAAERWMRFYRQSDVAVVRLVVDQTLHLLVLVLLIVSIIER